MDSLIKNLLETPTAPFRENLIRNFLSNTLSKALIPHFIDEVGNLIVGVDSPAQLKREILKKTKQPIQIFIAHMDHPGFLVRKKLSSTRFAFDWMGGGPVKNLIGKPLYLCNLKGEWRPATIEKIELTKSKRAIKNGVLKCSKANEILGHGPINGLFGGYHFKNWAENQNGIIYTKSADDLIGVFAILKSFLTKKNFSAKNIALLSIAEEVGWVGTLAHFQKTTQWKQATRPVVAISLEASKELPRAEMGKGAVVRLGDRATIFDTYYSQSLLNLAKKTLKKKFQFRVMDGGVCEGSVTQAWSIPTVAACVPLGNYHNENAQGSVGPEYIHANDVKSLCKLVEAIMVKGLFIKDRKLFELKQKKLLTELKENRRYLKESLKYF